MRYESVVRFSLNITFRNHLLRCSNRKGISGLKLSNSPPPWFNINTEAEIGSIGSDETVAITRSMHKFRQKK